MASKENNHRVDPHTRKIIYSISLLLTQGSAIIDYLFLPRQGAPVLPVLVLLKERQVFYSHVRSQEPDKDI